MRFESRYRFGFLSALALGTALSACGMPSRENIPEHPMDAVNTPKEDLWTPPANIAEIEERYLRAGNAQSAYENCLRRFTPDYDEQMRVYGEINLGAEGEWVSPAVAGCADVKRALDRAMEIAEGSMTD